MKSTLLFFSVLTFQSVLAQVDTELMMDQAYEYYESNQFKEAIALFDQVLKIEPNNEEGYYLRGICKHALGEVEAGVVDLEKAIRIDPDYVEAYQQLGYIYLVGQAPKEAIKAFDKALELDPSSAETYVNRGTAKCMMNDATGAMEDWKKAIALGVPYADQMVCD